MEKPFDEYNPELPENSYETEAQDDTPEPEPEPPAKKKKKHRLLRGLAILVLAAFLSGITFGSGYYIALRYGDVLQARLLDDSLENRASAIQVNQIQSVVEGGNGGSTSVAAIAEQVGPAVVTITNYMAAPDNRFFGYFGDSFRNNEGTGSGIMFKVDEEYLYILTNHHVINGAESLDVTFHNGQSLSVEALGYDSTMDLAVLAIPIDKVDATLDEIVLATFGDSDSLKVGEIAIAIGSPLGLEFSNSVTVGVVSATDRTLVLSSDQQQVNLIQTDAAINPGNSGGALVNGRGEIIGVNTAKYSDTSVEGMGFAIPINQAQPVIDSILASRSGSDVADELTADRPFLGVEISEITNEIYQETGVTFGVYVTGVFEGGAAEKAGILEGDIIYMLDGKRIANPQVLIDQLARHDTGDTIKIGIIRGEDVMTVEAVLTAYGDVVAQ